jgi:hypothetical protein
MENIKDLQHQVLVGQPFDIVKVVCRLQREPSNASLLLLSVCKRRQKERTVVCLTVQVGY